MGVVSVTDMLSPAILPEFERAGWLFGRDVGSPQDLPEDHPAVTVLRAFGGLVVGTVGDGEECATSDIHFHGVVGKEPLVVDWEGALGTTLVCVGEVHNGHGELIMDGVGRLFTNSAVHRAFGFVGPCFADGVERLLRGRKARPMLLPGESSVMLYGLTFLAGDPEVLTPSSPSLRW